MKETKKQSLEDKLNSKFASKSLGTINILGEEVNIREDMLEGTDVYAAYVEIKNSRFISSKSFGYSLSFREGDIIGVSSLGCKEGLTSVKKVMFVIDEMEKTINKLKEIMDIESVFYYG